MYNIIELAVQSANDTTNIKYYDKGSALTKENRGTSQIKF